jgi:hypothetical protein
MVVDGGEHSTLNVESVKASTSLTSALLMTRHPFADFKTGVLSFVWGRKRTSSLENFKRTSSLENFKRLRRQKIKIFEINKQIYCCVDYSRSITGIRNNTFYY